MKITQEEFDQLPALIPLRTFCVYSGLSRHTVGDMRAAGELRVWRPPGSKSRKGRYYKSDLARLTGFH